MSLKNTSTGAKVVARRLAPQKFLTLCKYRMLQTVAFVLLHSQMIRLINKVVNRFQLQTAKDSKLVFPFVQRRQSRNIQILTYHKINNDEDPFFPSTPTDVFAKQMEYLAHNFNVCPLEDAITMLQKCDVPDNTVVITFDDGYKDNYSNAFPILKRLSLHATIFLSTDVIGSGKVLWHDLVLSALRNTSLLSIKWRDVDQVEYSLRTLQDKLLAKRKILEHLWNLDDLERQQYIIQLLEKLEAEYGKINEDLMLTWDEVKMMHQHGISFGSHTVSHSILSKLPLDKTRYEISESRKIIEKNLGIPIKTFAYPNGRKCDFNDLTKQLIKENGYTCALTTIFGANEQGQDLFELRRGGPWERHIPLFATKLNWYKFCGTRGPR